MSFYHRSMAILSADGDMGKDLTNTDDTVADTAQDDDTADGGDGSAPIEDADDDKTNPRIAEEKKILTDATVAPEDRPLPQDVGLSVDAVYTDAADRQKQDELNSRN